MLYYKQENAIDFWQIVQDYMQGNLQGKSLPNECLARSVILIEIRGSKYILKADKEWDKRAEKRILRWILGGFYSRLFYRLENAQKLGCDLTNEICFVAERIRKFWCGQEVLESYMIYKYIEGTPLSSFSNLTPYLKAMQSLIAKLHSYGLASNDIRSENFILNSSGQLKIIDLSDVGFLPICQANDWLALKRFYGIEATNKTFFYYLIMWRNLFRGFLRKLRSKNN